MARVKIELGGKVVIAVVILGVVLLVFLRIMAATGTKSRVLTGNPSPTEGSQSGVVRSTAPGQTKSEAIKSKEPQPAATPERKTHAPSSVESETSGGPIKIFFEFNRAGINKNVYCIFDRIENVIQQQGSHRLRIVIEGNADSIGPKWYNVDLSRRRAARVADSLSRRLGIPVKSIELVANGSSKPITSNRTRDGRAENRRSEVYIYN